jgi:hypothetical protein
MVFQRTASMHLVQLLLPLYDNSGNAFSETVYTGIRRELTERLVA